MVKIRTIWRAKEDVQRETTGDVYRVYKNPDSNLHPLQKAREYTRALNSAKLEKIFAKPFVSAWDEHTDAICTIARSNKYLTYFASGTYDGEIKLWEVANNTSL
jgi:WD repeat and SOF domain-containing protein 1